MAECALHALFRVALFSLSGSHRQGQLRGIQGAAVLQYFTSHVRAVLLQLLRGSWLALIQDFVEGGLLVDLVVLLSEASLLLELEQFACGLLHWLQVGLARGDGLVKQPHLKLAQSLVKVETPVTADEFTEHLLA